jgi:hypothetical protein
VCKLVRLFDSTTVVRNNRIAIKTVLKKSSMVYTQTTKVFKTFVVGITKLRMEYRRCDKLGQEVYERGVLDIRLLDYWMLD